MPSVKKIRHIYAVFTHTIVKIHATTPEPSISSYYQRSQFLILAPNYLVLVVEIGFMTEQQVNDGVVTLLTCRHKQRFTVLDARGVDQTMTERGWATDAVCWVGILTLQSALHTRVTQ